MKVPTLSSEGMHAQVAAVVEAGKSPAALALRAYRRAVAEPGGTADPALLGQAIEAIDRWVEAIGDTWLPPELVRLAVELGSWRGDRAGTLAVLTRYLGQRLPTDEEAWARWQVVDHLAMLRRCAESVAAQDELVGWAEARYPPGGFLWAVSDGTQALCWREVGRADAWLELAARLADPATPANRFERFLTLRTTGMLLARLGRTDEPARVPDRLRAIADEDLGWDRAGEVRHEATALELNVLQQADDIPAIRAVGAATVRALLGETDRVPAGSDRSRALASRCHNTAAPLYRAGQYDLAVPLFRRAIALGTTSGHAHLWLAASVRATGGDRGEVEGLLRQAAVRFPGGDAWTAAKALPEFREDTGDGGFAAAGTR